MARPVIKTPLQLAELMQLSGEQPIYPPHTDPKKFRDANRGVIAVREKVLEWLQKRPSAQDSGMWDIEDTIKDLVARLGSWEFSAPSYYEGDTLGTFEYEASAGTLASLIRTQLLENLIAIQERRRTAYDAGELKE